MTETRHPAFVGNLAPVSLEADDNALMVVGSIPAAVEGTLYRIGPNPQFPPHNPARHHWFLGDGMVHAISMANGKASYRNRWVRTQKWLKEHEAGRTLFEGWGYLPVDGGPPPKDLDGTANTNLAWHAGRMFALVESRRPIEIDPVTLETFGQAEFAERLGESFTAHHKIDPVSNELLAFGIQSAGFGSLQVHYYAIGPSGDLERSETFAAPFPAFAHDFLVTQTHIIIPICPLVAHPENARRGGDPYVWEGARPTHIGIFSRADGAASIRWIEVPPSYVFHVFNAYDADDGTIVADVLQYDQAPLFPDENGTVPKTCDIRNTIMRWTINVENGSITQNIMAESPSHSLEFPQIDPRFSTLPHRFGWFLGREDPDGAGFNTLARVDFANGEVRSRQFGPKDMLSEPLFVPSAPDAPEGDGYLLFIVHPFGAEASELHIQDASDLAASPTAIVKLEHRIPQGFHGIWRQN